MQDDPAGINVNASVRVDCDCLSKRGNKFGPELTDLRIAKAELLVKRGPRYRCRFVQDVQPVGKPDVNVECRAVAGDLAQRRFGNWYWVVT